MNILATASSPLQLVNAAEAVQKLAPTSTNKHLVVRALKGSNNERVMRDVLERQQWDSVYWYSSERKIVQLPALLYKYKGTHWDYVMGGDFTSWWYNSLLANVTYGTHVLYDDGAKTVVDYENCLTTGQLPQKKKGGKDLILKLLGFKTMSFKFSPLVLFSIFNLPDTNHCSVIKNEMEWLRSQIGADVYATDGAVLFIGQPFIDTKAVQADIYYSIVRNALNSSESKKMIYTAHRGESFAVLEEIKKIGDIEVVSPLAPIELELYRFSQRISQIIGISSTALYTLKVLYKDIPTYRIELNDQDYIDLTFKKASETYHAFFGPYLPKFPGYPSDH
ncbi:MAG: polysialyltransferase family glycosyltransferase [Halopseudomonas sp.]